MARDVAYWHNAEVCIPRASALHGHEQSFQPLDFSLK